MPLAGVGIMVRPEQLVAGVTTPVVFCVPTDIQGACKSFLGDTQVPLQCLHELWGCCPVVFYGNPPSSASNAGPLFVPQQQAVHFLFKTGWLQACSHIRAFCHGIIKSLPEHLQAGHADLTHTATIRPIAACRCILQVLLVVPLQDCPDFNLVCARWDDISVWVDGLVL
jgi:hypothetical protein